MITYYQKKSKRLGVLKAELKVTKTKVRVGALSFNRGLLENTGVWSKDYGINWPILLRKIKTKDRELSLTLSEFGREASGSWVTCACGHQCAVIPRNEYGAPKDDELREHGGEFCAYMCHVHTQNCLGHRVELARSINFAKAALKLIERRSAVLIREITK